MAIGWILAKLDRISRFSRGFWFTGFSGVPFAVLFAENPPVILEVSTPALLFPAISLLFLSFTNRFLHLAALIRKLHSDWLEKGDETLKAQIDNLRRRLTLIRAMQLLGAVSLLLCVVSMLGVVSGYNGCAVFAFMVALGLMAASLASLVWEVWISGGALRILLNAVEGIPVKKS